MINFIFRKFISEKNSDNQRSSVGRLAGVLGFVTNGLLFLAKFIIALAAGSVSIMADAINSLTDTASSILTLVGFQIAAKPADKEHPYGHERFEYISGFVISLVITFVGFQFLLSSFRKILNPSSIKLNGMVFIILVLSILVKLWQSRMYQNFANKIKSSTLKATSQDSLNDVLTTLAVLLSAIVEGVTKWRIDGYVGFILALYIIYSGLKMVKSFIDELMGRRPTQEELDQMEKMLKSYPQILGYHDLLVHNYGPQKTFASVHIEVMDQWSLNQAHDVINLIEKDFHKKLEVNLVCHLDPVAIMDDTYQAKRKIVDEIVTQVAEGLTMHDFRVLSSNQMSFDVVVPKKCHLSDDELTDTIRYKIIQKLGKQTLEITFDHTYLLE